jgi:subtilisin family serine protease
MNNTNRIQAGRTILNGFGDGTNHTNVLSVVAFTAMWLLTLPLRAQLLPDIETGPGGAPCKRGEVIVQFKTDVAQAQIENAFRVGELHFIEHVRTPAMEDRGQFGITHAGTTLPVAAAVRVLKNLPGVEFAEPNWIASAEADSNDPLYLDGALWGMYGDDYPLPSGPDGTTNPFGSQAEKAWAAGYTGSRSVAVGVIDEGIQFDHPDLAPNIWTNPGENPANLLDEDGDGYLDDIHGWNAIDDSALIYDPGYDRHGTLVAGIIGAAGGNGGGVAGVNWNVTLISGKWLDRTGQGTILNAIKAIDYVVSLKSRKGYNIVALNHSWITHSYSQSLFDSFTRAAQAGILSVAAAGNNTNSVDLTPGYPACFDTIASAGYDSVISVAAITPDGQKADFSNWGATNVDLGAPGVTIYSTVSTDSYAAGWGTSFAAPYVTGAIALYASTHPGATPQQIRNDLLTVGVRPLPALEGITVTGGILDIGALMSVPPTTLPAPNPPANVQVVVVSGERVDVSWADQSSDELGFAVERSTDGVNFVLADTVGANFTTKSDRTVQPNTTYWYRVAAYNPGGASAYAYASTSVTTPSLSLPAAPTSLTATAQASGKGGGIALAWKDNANNEDAFQLERKTGSAGTWQLLTLLSANTIRYTDLSTTSRATYYYRLRAYNEAGLSAYSNQASATAK